MNRILFVLAASLSLFTSSPGAADESLGVVQWAGTDQVFVARPDPRDCRPVLPDCGGRFIYQITRPVEDLCNGELPFIGYVTRVVIRNDDGTLTEIDPPCDQPLPGGLEGDPIYPGYNMFVYLAYAG